MARQGSAGCWVSPFHSLDRNGARLAALGISQAHSYGNVWASSIWLA
jgi:hypothetical protein